jgi:Fe-S cluster biogenesis protein NfuA
MIGLLHNEKGTIMEQQVRDAIETVRPHLQADGGDIELVGVNEETGVVEVRLQGACKGCPGAAMTLKMGVERILKEKVPAVTEVVAVQ